MGTTEETMNQPSHEKHELKHDPSELNLGDLVMWKNKPELGIAAVKGVMYHRSGSTVWQIVHTNQQTWGATFSVCLEKLDPSYSKSGNCS